MSIREKPVDAVLVGFGWAGSIMAQQLCDAGLTVVALEKGPNRDTPVDFATTSDQDELRYVSYQKIFQNPARSTLTFRNTIGERALPIRRFGAFLPGHGVGGAGAHWNGQIWRFEEADFRLRTHNEQRYGKAAVADLTIADYPVSYDELEPYYAMFDGVAGTTGQAGNIKGVIQPGGDPFEGPRSGPFPNPPMRMGLAQTLFADAARGLGLSPFPQPGGNMSRAYTNTLGLQMGACTYCGFCEEFGCGNYSKASPQACIIPYVLQKANFELRAECEVLRIEKTRDGRMATGVTYVDADDREHFQPASMVILSAFQFHNVHLMLVSGIGRPYDPVSNQGVVGRNFCYQTMGFVDLFMADKRINPFIGAGALGSQVNNYNGDNFDHAGLGFIGGGSIGAQVTNGRPIHTMPVPQGTPSWGAAWKKEAVRWYNRSFTIEIMGASHAQRANYLDLDPTWRDRFGRPMLRMTFDFPPNDIRMSAYCTDRAAAIGRAMNPAIINVRPMKNPFSIVPYQSTHIVGGTMTGSDPSMSVVNKYGQSWDVPNLFVTGANLFPQNPGYNPTGTVAALAYHSAAAIKERYLRAAEPLVRA